MEYYSLDTAWWAIPDTFCGQCGTEVPDGKAHCSPECAERAAAILAKAKGVA
jgi:predicted nucleic acid-binding Zn ribbon protein